MDLLLLVLATGSLLACESDSSTPNVQPLEAEQTPFPEAGRLVEVVAGGGALLSNGLAAEPGFRDGPADQALFDRPVDVGLELNGALVIADSGNRRIRRLTADGIVETVAGTGEDGVRDGPANQAQFRTPVGIAVGRDGTIFVSDAAASMIRAIGPDGVVRTVAGIDFVACLPTETKDRAVASQTPASCPGRGEKLLRDGPGANAVFDEPAGLVLNSEGDLFVADSDNHCIRRIDSDGNVTTFAGTCEPGHRDGPAASAQFSAPTDLVFGSDGNLYLTEAGRRIRAISPLGDVSTVSGGAEAGHADGPASVARFKGLAAIAIDPAGRLLAVEGDGQTLRGVLRSGFAATLAGTGSQSFRTGEGNQAQFSYPVGLAIAADGRAFVADYNLNRIFVVVQQ